jgi:hypothetical protein
MQLGLKTHRAVQLRCSCVNILNARCFRVVMLHLQLVPVMSCALLPELVCCAGVYEP